MSYQLNLKPGVKFRINQEEVSKFDLPKSITDELASKQFCISQKGYQISFVCQQEYADSKALEMSLTEAFV